MTFYPLAPLSVFHDGYRQLVTIDGIDFLLLQHKGRRYLLENDCPHAAYPLAEGRIIGTDLRCPMHGYLFSLETGECTYYTEGPCRALKHFDVVEREGQVGVER